MMRNRYKGMASSTTSSNASSQLAPTATGRGGTSRLTPQSTGFSQIGGGRPGAGDGGQGAAMSVLLSWHEKVVEVAGLGAVGRCGCDWRRV